MLAHLQRKMKKKSIIFKIISLASIDKICYCSILPPGNVQTEIFQKELPIPLDRRLLFEHFPSCANKMRIFRIIHVVLLFAVSFIQFFLKLSNFHSIGGKTRISPLFRAIPYSFNSANFSFNVI